MTVKTEYQACAMCDICGENYVEAFWTQKQLISELRKQGWSIGKKAKCPKCKKQEESNG
jgi:hypothetical protein